MTKSTTGFHAPVSMARPRGSRRVDVYGIKLNRRVQCFSDAAYHQWVCLEADPRVHAYCERPALVEYGEERLMVDYWVRKSDGDSLLILDEDVEESNFDCTFFAASLS